jgi:hypothetical protein
MFGFIAESRSLSPGIPTGYSWTNWGTGGPKYFAVQPITPDAAYQRVARASSQDREGMIDYQYKELNPAKHQ